jgi:DNA-binding winged helix-turn-helix (wHTH) protein
VFQVLTYLLEQHHRVVTRQELFEQVWPMQFVSDAALESSIKAVQQAIGDSGATPRMIQTLRGCGYRFIAAVEACAAMPADDATGLTLDQDHVGTPPPHPTPTLVGERKPVTILCCGLAAPHNAA